MIFWFFTAIFIIALTLLVVWSVSRFQATGSSAETIPVSESDIVIYKSQFVELDGDVKKGLIDSESAQEARLELARNILASEKINKKPIFTHLNSGFMRYFLVVGVLLVPAITLGVYCLMGSPGVKSYTFSQALEKDPSQLTLAEKLVRTEFLFHRDPQNGKLADELASSYFLAGQFQQAANSYVDSLSLNGESGPRLVGYGMAMMGYDGGIITQKTQSIFEKAAAIAPNDFYPQYFLAQAYTQAGRPGEAADHLQAFLDKNPKTEYGAQRIELLIKELRQANLKVPTPQASMKSNEQPEIPADQTVMITSMVDGLAARLKDNPDDLEGWKKLVHSWVVLKKLDKARSALDEGTKKLTPKEADALLQYAVEQKLISPNAKNGDQK